MFSFFADCIPVNELFASESYDYGGKPLID